MSVRTRLAAFGAALAVVFAATFTAGSALGPDEERPPATTTTTTTEPVAHAPGHGS